MLPERHLRSGRAAPLRGPFYPPTITEISSTRGLPHDIQHSHLTPIGLFLPRKRPSVAPLPSELALKARAVALHGGALAFFISTTLTLYRARLNASSHISFTCCPRINKILFDHSPVTLENRWSYVFAGASNRSGMLIAQVITVSPQCSIESRALIGGGLNSEGLLKP